MTSKNITHGRESKKMSPEKVDEEIKRHESRIQEIAEESGVAHIKVKVDSLVGKKKSAEESFENIKSNFYEFLCEATEGERTTIRKYYTLRDDSLYEYSSENEVSFRTLYRNLNTHGDNEKYKSYSGRDGVSPFNNVHLGLRDKAVDDMASEQIDNIFDTLSDNRQELKAIDGNFTQVHGENFVKVETYNGCPISSYRYVYVLEWEDYVLAYSLKDDILGIYGAEDFEIYDEDNELKNRVKINKEKESYIHINLRELSNLVENTETLKAAMEFSDPILDLMGELSIFMDNIVEEVQEIEDELNGLSPYVMSGKI